MSATGTGKWTVCNQNKHVPGFGFTIVCIFNKFRGVSDI
jgi:hypothetical protein